MCILFRTLVYLGIATPREGVPHIPDRESQSVVVVGSVVGPITDQAFYMLPSAPRAEEVAPRAVVPTVRLPRHVRKIVNGVPVLDPTALGLLSYFVEGTSDCYWQCESFPRVPTTLVALSKKQERRRMAIVQAIQEFLDELTPLPPELSNSSSFNIPLRELLRLAFPYWSKEDLSKYPRLLLLVSRPEVAKEYMQKSIFYRDLLDGIVSVIPDYLPPNYFLIGGINKFYVAFLGNLNAPEEKLRNELLKYYIPEIMGYIEKIREIHRGSVQMTAVKVPDREEITLSYVVYNQPKLSVCFTPTLDHRIKM